jgi:hypothetical protein
MSQSSSQCELKSSISRSGYDNFSGIRKTRRSRAQTNAINGLNHSIERELVSDLCFDLDLNVLLPTQRLTREFRDADIH